MYRLITVINTRKCMILLLLHSPSPRPIIFFSGQNTEDYLTLGHLSPCANVVAGKLLHDKFQSPQVSVSPQAIAAGAGKFLLKTVARSPPLQYDGSTFILAHCPPRPFDTT